MCGIAGFIKLRKPDFDVTDVILDMTKSLVHRGPDDEGIFSSIFSEKSIGSVIALGHRRLKIIDLSQKAHQPMHDNLGNFLIIFNGEIYNYIELRQELQSKGYIFSSEGDTEVVLNAYIEWGIECFKRFNGMWALAIFDKRSEKIIVSRDRFGKKPLYYYKTDSEFIFASEIKALLKYPNIRKEPNYEKIFRYLSSNYRYVDIDEFSFFKDIFQVPKASFVEIDKQLNIKIEKYWELGLNISERQITGKTAVEGFRDLLVDSVRLRLRSDVPVGCMLSGGMDSTSITCIAYKILKNPIVTFSGITGKEKGVYDESEYIDSVINETDAKYHYIIPDPADIFDTVNEMLEYHDEPICTVTWYSLYLIAKKMRLENVPVVLNGHGGDELLAGYWDHYHYYFYDLEKNNDLGSLEHEKKCWLENYGRDPLELIRSKEYIESLEAGKINSMSKFTDYSDCFTEDIQKKNRITFVVPTLAKGSRLLKRLYSEILYETIPPSLRPEDRNTMSQSIESRSPFLDYRLAEFCFSLPDKFKIRDGFGKWILREAMKGILPENVRTRRYKSGFIAPADEWFRTINRKQISDMITSESFKKRGIFNVKRIGEIFEEHLQKKKNHQMFLWQLINVELWFKKFFDFN